ncbi:MAG: tripartite tricarboxylate transporter substrate-binding protein, partial [Gemmatimonadota bacterium]|nr:tripartite tricarboxylate transporter substrate-binding protein [Gemmatimonadota bacterium]
QLIRSRPDGRTLAIVNGTGLLIAPWSNPEFAPDIPRDFTILGRVAHHHQVLVTGPKSNIRAPEDLLRRRQEGRPLVLGETGPATINFLLAAILEDLFGVPVQIVLGFPGSAEILAAVRRGDLDGVVIGYESARLSPDLTPVLLFGERAAADDPWYRRAAKLNGDDGLVATRPELFSGGSGRMREDVEALSTIMQVGRLVVGPAGMADALETCLSQAVLGALQGDVFAAALARGNRTASPASGTDVRGYLDHSKELLPRFQATVERAARKVRG